MNSRRNVEIANVGVPLRCDKVPLFKEDVNDEQALGNPSPLMDENIRAALFQMDQAITT